MKNLNALSTLRNGKKLVDAAKSMNAQKESFTDNQLSYIDSIYEKVFLAKGFDGVNVHHDRKRV